MAPADEGQAAAGADAPNPPGAELGSGCGTPPLSVVSGTRPVTSPSRLTGGADDCYARRPEANRPMSPELNLATVAMQDDRG